MPEPEEDPLFEDDPGERGREFFERLGIPANLFNVAVLQPAIARALADPVDAPPQPWVPLGGRNIGGRIRALAQDPANASTLYGGTAQGGVFRTRDAGDTWEPLGDPQDAWPVGALAVAPGDPRILYVGTGEPVQRAGGSAGAYTSGLGFYQYDGSAVPPRFIQEAPPLPGAGAAPNGAANHYARIVVDPHEPGRCWIACHTGLWRREPGPPVSFVREPVPTPPPAAGAAPPNFTDVALAEGWDPGRPRTYRIYAAVAGKGIYRGFFDPAAAPPATAWDAAILGGGMAAGGTMDRIRLALCKSQPQHLYALMENSANSAFLPLHHSANGGDNWNAMTIPGPHRFAWYCMALAVHPFNPAFVIAGGIDLYRSGDSGANWIQILDWTEYDRGDRAQHADQHEILFDALDRHKIWVANDGGIAMCPDIRHGNPNTDRTWRKRSHGILAAQFNDITVHPSFPFIMGGGLQDNGTYIGFGGPTWYHVGFGDGGEMAFEVNNPRLFYFSAGAGGGWVLTSTVVAGNTPPPAPPSSLILSPVIPEQAPPNDVIALQVNTVGAMAAGGLFVGVVEHHPVTPQNMLVGRRGAGFVTTNAASLGTTFANLGLPAFPEQVSALAYQPGVAAPNADWWVGTARGRLFRGVNAPPAATLWNAIALPFPVAAVNPWISRITIHPNDATYMAVATGGTGTAGGTQGRVFLSLDRGQNWADITGLAAVGAPAVGAPPLQSLPPCPISSLAFDPSVPAGNPQVLFAGTLVGVYVIRNLPARRVPPAAGAVPAFNPQWFSFNNRQLPAPPAPLVPGQLPLVLVNDLVCVDLPATPGAVAGSPEAARRQKLICATFGRGMYECDLAPPVPPLAAGGGPRHRLFIRQYVVEDGLSYPRPTPAGLNAAPAAPIAGAPPLNGDPRMPAGTVLFDLAQAFDIRVDNAPFLFFGEVLDGVEFDEDLKVKTLDPGELNLVYVQVHNRGWEAVSEAHVHLFFAPVPAAVAAGAAAPDLHADFWAHYTDEPALPPPAVLPVPAPAVAWQRVGRHQTLRSLRPNQPKVARFEWNSPASLAGGRAALLAVCTSPSDPLPGDLPTVMGNLLLQERRVAFRVVPVGPFRHHLYIRDGIEDDGTPGAVAFGGRSPDIIVVQSAPAQPPRTEFQDLADPRAGDHIKGGSPNLIYVRVHNRKSVPVEVDVEVLFVKTVVPMSAAADPGAPPFDPAKWRQITPVATATKIIPAQDWEFVQVQWDNPPDPDQGAAEPYQAYLLIALIKSHDNADPAPVRTRADGTPAGFWSFFRHLADSRRVAMRALRYKP